MSFWYVRPAGGSYGAENGTSYADAWDGLLNVVWGSGGVVAGDTLYVCGLHIHTYTTYVNRLITPTSGTNDSTRTVIRGDYPGDVGIIWGAAIVSYASWVDEGDNTWSINIVGDHFRDWWFEDVTAGSWVVLTPVADLATCKSTPGSHYSATYGTGTAIYVHCSDNGNPTGRIAQPRLGYRLGLTGCSYLTFLNLKIYNNWRFVSEGFTNQTYDYVTFDGCTMWYGEHSVVTVNNSGEGIQVLDCDIGWAQNGIYNISNSAPFSNADNYIYRGNAIHDMGVRPAIYSSDAHAIGIMGGHDGLIENNLMYNCGSAIVLYVNDYQDLYNTTVRYNFIRDGHLLGGANGYGIEWSGDAAQYNNRSNNKTYYNIIDSMPGEGIKVKQSAYEHILYNNVVRNATGASYRFYDSTGGDGLKIVMRNNISINPSQYHINYTSALPNEYIKSDYNIFYPVSGDQFYFKGTGYTFAGWQGLSDAPSIFDPNSLTSDPAFLNAGGSYALDTDFKIPNGSPAQDAGTDVGLTGDYFGYSVPFNAVPDIGIHEYQGDPPAAWALYGTVAAQSQVTGGLYQLWRDEVPLKVLRGLTASVTVAASTTAGLVGVFVYKELQATVTAVSVVSGALVPSFGGGGLRMTMGMWMS